MQPASGSDEDGSHGEHSAKERPTKFVYDENDTFYFPPAICKLLHYRSAAILCGLVEVALLALTVLAFFSTHNHSQCYFFIVANDLQSHAKKQLLQRLYKIKYQPSGQNRGRKRFWIGFKKKKNLNGGQKIFRNLSIRRSLHLLLASSCLLAIVSWMLEARQKEEGLPQSL